MYVTVDFFKGKVLKCVDIFSKLSVISGGYVPGTPKMTKRNYKLTSLLSYLMMYCVFIE
jgi:hypothetical protein